MFVIIYQNRSDAVCNHHYHQIAELQSQLELTIEEKNKTREELDSTIERVSPFKYHLLVSPVEVTTPRRVPCLCHPQSSHVSTGSVARGMSTQV